jgi:hypothetical protein
MTGQNSVAVTPYTLFRKCSVRISTGKPDIPVEVVFGFPNLLQEIPWSYFKKGNTNSFLIPSNSWFINHHTIQRYIVQLLIKVNLFLWMYKSTFS